MNLIFSASSIKESLSCEGESKRGMKMHPEVLSTEIVHELNIESKSSRSKKETKTKREKKE